MRQVIAILAALVVVGLVHHAAPVWADEICYEADFTYTNNSGATQKLYATPFDEGRQRFTGGSHPFAELNPGDEFDGTVQVDIEAGSGDIVLFSTAPAADRKDVGTVRASLIGQSTLHRCNVFNDGRLNDGDAAAPVIVYNDGDAFTFYDVNNTGAGTEILRVPLTDIRPAVTTAVQTGENQLIVEQSGIAVYALSAGTCQINVFLLGGSQYVFEWRCNLAPTLTGTGSSLPTTETAPNATPGVDDTAPITRTPPPVSLGPRTGPGY